MRVLRASGAHADGAGVSRAAGSRRGGILRGFGVAAAAIALVACGGGDAPASQPSSDVETVRVVSLSPAITRTMIDLGAGDLLVGRTPYCRGAGSDVPAVGSLLEFDPEAMLAVDPDLVLVQPGAAGIDPDLSALALREAWTVHSWRIDGLDDLERLLEELPAALAGAPGADTIARRAAERRADLAAVLTPLSGAASPVMVLFAMEPPMAFGQGTFVGDMLERCGVENAVPSRGYPELSIEDLASRRPARIVLLRDAASEAPQARLATLPLPTPPARRHVIEHPDALTPGSAWIEAAAKLRATIASEESGR